MHVLEWLANSDLNFVPLSDYCQQCKRWLSVIIGSVRWRRSLGRASRSIEAKVWLLITRWRRNIFAKINWSWVRRQFAKILWSTVVGKLAGCIFESTRNQPKGNIQKSEMKCAPVELLMNETTKKRWWEKLFLFCLSGFPVFTIIVFLQDLLCFENASN